MPKSAMKMITPAIHHATPMTRPSTASPKATPVHKPENRLNLSLFSDPMPGCYPIRLELIEPGEKPFSFSPHRRGRPLRPFQLSAPYPG